MDLYAVDQDGSKKRDADKPKKIIWVAKATRLCLKTLSPLKLLCKTRDALSFRGCRSEKNFISPEPVHFPAKSRSRREEENLRRLIQLMESKTHFIESAANATPETVSTPPPRPSLAALRSSSVHTTIAPIDEDNPCYFPGSFKKKWATPLPRTGSCGNPLG
eukprot:Gb_23793 [translate_table: standard]